MSLEIDPIAVERAKNTARWVLANAICRHCGRPSWDHFPAGVVADRYRCGYCGHAQTDGGLAEVARISRIDPHPNADRLDLLLIERPYGSVQLVTGKHYRAGDLGVWLKPGAQIPGWLAHDLWLVGKKRIDEPFEVRDMPIRGHGSAGLWCGEWYRNDNSKESALRAAELHAAGGEVVDGWVHWPRWNPRWQVGDVVEGELGLTPILRIEEDAREAMA